MTLEQMQEYLDRIKWEDSERHGGDMCGRYARCRYCRRTEETPCARAHERLLSVQASPDPEPIPAWLIPEPEIPADLPAGIPAQGASAARRPTADGAREERPHTIARGKRGGVRLLILTKKPSAERTPAAE